LSSDCGREAEGGDRRRFTDSPVTDQVVDGVDAKGIEPVVVILDIPWGSDGPWVVALEDRVRDALAGVDDARLPELAAWWTEIEEPAGYTDAEVMLSGRAALAGPATTCTAGCAFRTVSRPGRGGAARTVRR
jgi:hypothetical protein